MALIAAFTMSLMCTGMLLDAQALRQLIDIQMNAPFPVGNVQSLAVQEEYIRNLRRAVASAEAFAASPWCLESGTLPAKT